MADEGNDYNWFDEAPLDFLYPWKGLNIPWTSSPLEANMLAEKIKQEGNESFKKEHYYDALWKYEHSLTLLGFYPTLRVNMPVVMSNVAACCLKLGDQGRMDLIQDETLMLLFRDKVWYVFCTQASTQAINMQPGVKIAFKAHWRRAESTKKIFSTPDMMVAIEQMLQFTSSAGNPLEQMVCDYVKCFELQDNPEPKPLVEAIMLAVEHDYTHHLPVLMTKHVRSGVPTAILKEFMSSQSTTSEHLNCLLLEVSIQSSLAPHYEVDWLDPSALMKKKVYSLEAYKKLVRCGMTVTPASVEYAVQCLARGKIELFKYLVDQCPQRSNLIKAADMASSLKKKYFLDVLKEFAESSFDKLRESGNSLFSRGCYEEALSKYFQAINYCKKRNMMDEVALIRANCAQACLKLELYSDAYSHSSECVRLDPQNHKGYFRRAEALRNMLESPSSISQGTHMDLVKDYLKCHSLQSNVEAFCKALVVAVEQKCTRLIPKLRHSDVMSGFSDGVLQYVMDKVKLTAPLLEFICVKLPDAQVHPIVFKTHYISLRTILRVTTETQVVTSMIGWGAQIKEEDVIAAGVHIPNDKAVLIDCLLPNCSIASEDDYQTIVTLACNEAMKSNKVMCVVAFLRHGATPHPEELLHVPGILNEPVARRYYQVLNSVHSTSEKVDSLSEPGDDSTTRLKKHVEYLNRQAKASFKANKMEDALRCYSEALYMCKENHLRHETAALHNNLAHIFLVQSKYKSAYSHAHECIKITQNNAKAYFRRGEAIKNGIRNGEINQKAPESVNYHDVLSDFKKSYGLKKDMKVLQEGVPFASEYKLADFFYDECSELSEDECLQLLKVLMAHRSCQSETMNFVAKVWKNKKVKCSGINMKILLTEKKVSEPSTLSWFLSSGVIVDNSDVRICVQCLADKKVESFKVLLAHCDHLDKDNLSQDAHKAGKINFLLHLLREGAALPSDHEAMIRQLLSSKNFNGVEIVLKLLKRESIEKLDLSTLLQNNLVHHQKLISAFIEAGVSPNGKMSPIVTVMRMTHLKPEVQVELVCLLIKHGANCNQLCQATTHVNITPLHVATELSLKIGNTDLIDVVAPKLKEAGIDKFVNDKGESPLHIAVKPHLKRDASEKVLSALLSKDLLNPTQKDKSNKKPSDYLKSNDSRVKMLQDYSKSDASSKSKKKKKKRNSDKPSKVEPKVEIIVDDEANHTDAIVEVKGSDLSSPSRPMKAPKKEVLYENRSILEKATYHLDILFKKSDSFFTAHINQGVNTEGDTSSEYNQASLVQAHSPRHQLVPPFDKQKLRSPIRSPVRGPHTGSIHGSPQSSHSDPLSSSSAVSPAVSLADFGIDMEGLPNFDALPWEVEVTRNVVKFFKIAKNSSPVDRVRAANVIYQIAEGRRNQHLSKIVSNNSDVCLYEARITQSGRILWEKAIAYSSRLTGESDCAVYAQVIRVWEVVLDHDELDTKITNCVDQIEQSYKRGYMASIQWSLQPLELGRDIGKVRGQDILDFPSTYVIQSQDILSSAYRFVPAASTKDTEYNVTTFYSFDSMTVKSMIAGTNDRRDYPFKEWQKEHEIIKLKSNEAILLLGRSGTGKTTCCLYRLWNEFRNHWDPYSLTFGIKIPRKALISSSSLSSEDSAEVGMTDGVNDVELEDDGLSNGKDSDVFEIVLSDTESDDGVMIEESLHQVFITKNYVLCDQMKKRFYSMAAAYDFLEPHLAYEDVLAPNSLGCFEDLSFPAFLTARQFYILLDNSLEDGNSFFKRDEEGNLQVRIVSLDYDHEDQDLLLDLDESDSEDEDLDVMNTDQDQPAQRLQRTEKWTEVTALYFKEVVWPRISHQCKVEKDIDPMLVWLEIQSFIKGSERAVVKGSPLSFAEYQEIGNRMAPNFSSHRELIYKLYRYYQSYIHNQRYKCYLFDECDLILNLHGRLKEVKDVSWSIHSVYIDEVQDFTQAELAVFIHCCRDPNSMFFTGDTAQSIMRGIAFRFEDLRSCFYRLNRSIPSISVPQKPLNLTINYRSHSGILKLAGTIIDLIKEFFRDSIDHLPDDEGMFPGPFPVFMDSCKEEDLSLLLSTNKRECSAIEFGAHQVILVQSKEAKDKLPQILKGAIVLTIFEAKGLEFDDVLLYNFFSDSMVDEKVWRVVASYLEIYDSKIEGKEPLPGASSQARSKSFDAVQHKSLNAELKYLYTAVTRAKCNLWIYDSDIKARLPMLEYWHKRKAVKVVTADSGSDQAYNLVFASNSTSDQWKAQGDNFRKKHLWEQAILCYQRAGSNYLYLVKEAQAYHLIQGARQHKPALFLEAALRFLECSNLKFSIQCLTGAALCLKNSRPPRYTQAAKLFEKLNDPERAAQLYLKAKDFDNFVRIQESRGEYDSVIRSLLGKTFLRKRDALAKIDEYEKKGYSIDPKYTTSELSFSCAKFYSERKDKQTLLEVLRYMPEQDKRVKFMKEAELFEEAYTDYVSNNQFSGAYRLALAHGWFDKAFELAEKHKDEAHLAQFVFLKAKDQLAKTEKYNVDKYPPDHFFTLLKKFRGHKNELVKAESNLILGMLQKDHACCVKAMHLFKMKDRKAGVLESFDGLSEASDQEVLNCCHMAKKLAKSLRGSKDMLLDVQYTMKFYGFQLLGKAYLTSRKGHYFVPFDAIQTHICEDSQYDVDSMVRMKLNVRDRLASRFEHLYKEWISRYKLDSKLYAKCGSFTLHSELWKNRRLSRQFSLQELSSKAMLIYVQNCVYVLELRLLRGEIVDGTLIHLEVIFSPEVSMCLPCLNSDHVHVVRKSANYLVSFKSKLERDLGHLCAPTPDSTDSDKPERLLMDSWLSIWRLASLSCPSMKPILAKLEEIEENVRKTSQHNPLGYIFWKNDHRFLHIFRFWLNSCSEVRENGKMLWSTKLAITHFLGNVVENKQISISIPNMVNVITIHSMALLAMMTQSNFINNYPQKFAVPHVYKHVVEMFNHMNCRRLTSGSDKSLFSACVHEGSSNRNPRFFSDCCKLLNTALNYLIGGHERAPKYSVLKYGLYKGPNTEQTLQCVILTLTIFGNLSFIWNVRKSEEKIMSIFGEFARRSKTLPKYVKMVLTAYDTHSMIRKNSSHKSNVVFTPNVVFNLISEFLALSKKDDTISRISFKQKRDSNGHIEMTPMTTKPNRPAQVHNLPEATERYPGSKIAPQPLESISQSKHEVKSLEPNPQVSSFPESTSPLYPSTVHPQQIQNPPINNAFESNQASNMPSTVFDYSNNGQTHYGQVQSDYSSEGIVYPTSSEEVTARPLSAFAEQFVPSVPMQDMETQPISDSPSINSAVPPQSEHFHPHFAYFKDSDTPSQIPPDFDHSLSEDNTIDDYDYALTQPQKPFVYIDPSLVTEDIIDRDNRFCISCGTKYREDEQLEFDDEEEILEEFQQHFSGQHHCDRAKAMLSFIAKRKDYDLYQVHAEDKLKECEELNQSIDTDLLDHSIDNLKDANDKYNLIISEVQDNRMWDDGARKVENALITLQRLVKEASDQLCKADLVKVKEEQKRNRLMLEVEEDQEAIEKMRDEYASDITVTSGKSNKVRTEDDKMRSRNKRRKKKRRK